MKRIISLTLALIICLSYTFIFSASAAMMGDVDGNGSITAADARLALRASVKLDKLSEEQTKIADVDDTPGVTAADARLILRASVGLEELHTHSYESKITKEATCTESGILTKTCKCGETITEVIPATGHNYEVKVTKEASCSQAGVLTKTCKCGDTITEEIPKTEHSFNKLSVTKQATAKEYGEAQLSCSNCTDKIMLTLCTHTFSSIKANSVSSCTVSGCKGEFPPFNIMVNSLKTPGSLNFFYSYTKTRTVTDKPTVKPSSILHAGLASTMETLLGDSIAPGEVTEYSDFTNRRHVNNATFYVPGKSYVSNLADSDTKSITVKKISGVDFVKSLPSSYKSTVSGKNYSLNSIKNSSVGEVYKITVTLNSEKITDKKFPTTITPIEKIINTNYNAQMKKQMESLNSAFTEEPTMADMMGAEVEVTTDCTLSYYFTTDKLEPVASTYDVNIATVSKIHTYFDNFFIKHDNPTTTMTVKSTAYQTDYYFFNDHFSVVL